MTVICRACLRAVVTLHLDGCFSVLGSLHVELQKTPILPPHTASLMLLHHSPTKHRTWSNQLQKTPILLHHTASLMLLHHSPTIHTTYSNQLQETLILLPHTVSSMLLHHSPTIHRTEQNATPLHQKSEQMRRSRWEHVNHPYLSRVGWIEFSLLIK